MTASPLALVGALAALLFATTCGAEAKLGQSIDSFRAQMAQFYKFKGMTNKQDRSYYMFSMMASNSVKQEAPGFGIGMTMTVVDRKIVSQAMAIHIGDNYDKGKELATLHAVDFVYESIGKPPPKSRDAAQSEFQQFSTAIDQVLGGTAQHVSYPGYPQRITMKRTQDGDLLIAVTPDFSGENKKNGKGH